jgi:hypothetical protein
LVVGDGTITANWIPPQGAASFLLRWKKSADAHWDQVPVGAATYTLNVENNIPYDVALASVDVACNASAFTEGHATPHLLAAVARVPMSDYESNILSKSLVVEGSKDGTPTKSPYPVEIDKDQNGIPDADEDKNGNGIKDGEENKTPETTQTKDNSRLIAIIAVILIIAGAALAAYSWYRGDDSPTDSGDGGTGSPPPPTKSAAPPKEEKAETPKPAEEGSKRNRGGKGGKRKTRW